jgi:hypothetical protein
MFIFMSPIFGQINQKSSFVEEPNAPEGKALIYFYMPGSLAKLTIVWIMVNNKPLTIVSSGSYSPCLLDKGQIKFILMALQKPDIANAIASVSINFEDGQTYFIKVVYGNLKPDFIIVLADEAKTNDEILGCFKMKYPPTKQ